MRGRRRRFLVAYFQLSRAAFSLCGLQSLGHGNGLAQCAELVVHLLHLALHVAACHYAAARLEPQLAAARDEGAYGYGLVYVAAKPYEARLKNLKRVGSGLYNGMIYPLRDYRVKAAVWYQGETNAGNPAPYADYLKALITNWRELWQWPDMPFLLVQLPNFMEKKDRPTDSGWARIRDAQFRTALSVPHTELAVTYDVGEWNDIHPLDKKTVAHRLFLGARRLVYGEKVNASGPLYRDMQVDGDRIVLSFTETGRGLACRGKELKHFAIAGEDRKFVWAKAVIRGNKVVVSSPEVKHPVAVRYAWSDNPSDANLCNKDGLLASPFRTDNW